MSTAFRPFLQRAGNGAVFSEADMQRAIGLILGDEVSDVETAGFLMALRARGEQVEEIAGAASAMRRLAVHVETPSEIRNQLIDTAGTGGDGAATFNISTAAALIAAGAGAYVAKHGNRAASSLSGSSDVLGALGVNLQAGPDRIANCIANAHVGFLFAAWHHKAVARVAGVRKALGVRTLFNLLGPLTNPAGARRQLVGVFDPALVDPMAQALRHLGGTHGWVVHGSDGLDELTITGPSRVCAFDPSGMRAFDVVPEDAGLQRHPIDAIRGGNPDVNAAALRALLSGEKNAYRDVSILNAAAALVVAGKTTNLKDGAALAADAIDSGRARQVLDTLIHLSNEDIDPATSSR